jgi:hypothetical protein
LAIGVIHPTCGRDRVRCRATGDRRAGAAHRLTDVRSRAARDWGQSDANMSGTRIANASSQPISTRDTGLENNATSDEQIARSRANVRSPHTRGSTTFERVRELEGIRF